MTEPVVIQIVLGNAGAWLATMAVCFAAGVLFGRAVVR